jgi:hypothetical protein
VPPEFEVLVYREGLYALRLVYFDGGGGASLEWYGIYEDGASPDSVDGRVLINGLDSSLAPRARAFRHRTEEPMIPSPELAIAMESGQILLSWNAQAEFRLESRSDLNSGTWLLESEAPEVNGDRKSIRLSLATGSSFFRLRRP